MLGVAITDILFHQAVGVILRMKHIVSTNKGEPIVNMENTKAGNAYMNIARRILGDDIPIPDFETPPPTFVDRIKNLFLATAAKA